MAIASSSLVNYLYSLALTHGLEPRLYSEFAAGQALLLLLATLGGVAVPWVLAREVARSGGDEAQLGRALTFAFWVNVMFGLILGALVAVISSWIGPPPIPEVMAASVLLLSIGSTGFGYLQGRQQYGRLAVVIFGEIALKVSVGFYLVGVLRLSAWAALFAATVGALVPLSVCLPLRRLIGRPVWRIGPEDRDLWRSAWRIGSIQVPVAVLAMSDTVLVAILRATRDAAGQYQAAGALGRIPLFISAAVSIAVFPSLSLRGSAKEKRIAALESYVVLAAITTVILLTVPQQVVSVLFPASFSSVAGWLRYTAPLGCGIGLLNLQTTFVQAEERVGLCRRVLMLGMVVEICAIVVGAEGGGVRGLAIGSDVAVWMTAVLVGCLRSERSAVIGLIRKRRPVVGYVVAALEVAGLTYVHQPVVWVGLAVVAVVSSLFVSFPEARRAASRMFNGGRGPTSPAVSGDPAIDTAAMEVEVPL